MPRNIQSLSYQGIEGSYSHTLCQQYFPKARVQGCAYFEDALTKVDREEVDAVCIPIENNLGGRVAEIHHLLTETSLYIVQEHFLKIAHCLLVPPGGTAATVHTVHSHPQALIQCRRFIIDNGYREAPEIDTAVAAREVADLADRGHAAIASVPASHIYGLTIANTAISNLEQNITRFIIMQREPMPLPIETEALTSIMFQIRSVPAALYKALGGFARQGVNLIKIESYINPTSFNVAQFYIEIGGTQNNPSVAQSIKELQRYSQWVRSIGSYAEAKERQLFFAEQQDDHH